MTEKRFKHLLNAVGMQFICYDDKEILMGAFADADGVAHIVEILNELAEENEQLKQSYKEFEDECQSTFNAMSRKQNDLYRKNFKLKEENEKLKQQKPFLKIIDDYFIQYEDGEFFNLHKPSDIRSLMYILNREHGYSELQCEYNDLEKGDME